MVHSGDEVEIVMNKAGVPPRRGTIEKVLEEDPLRLEIRWDDGHLSVLSPKAGNLHVVRAAEG